MSEETKWGPKEGRVLKKIEQSQCIKKTIKDTTKDLRVSLLFYINDTQLKNLEFTCDSILMKEVPQMCQNQKDNTDPVKKYF